MAFKTVLMTAALASAVLALPLTSEPSGIKIPLFKREATGPSPISPAARKTAVRRLEDKYYNGRAAFQHKTGRAIANSTALTEQEIAEWLKGLFPAGRKTKRASGGDALTDQESDALWAGSISIGTPGQSFIVDFDTGSSDLGVPSSTCSSCGSHNTYNSGSSSSSRSQSGTFSMSYGDGSTASGPEYSDTVTVAGLTATNQKLAAVTSESSSFNSDPSDGMWVARFVLSDLDLFAEVPSTSGW